MTFAGIVACQVGTALAARTEHASLRTVGLLTNPMLLLQDVFGTAALDPTHLALLAVFPFVVWGADELRRACRRDHTESRR